jgi:hypothetical protein
MSPKELKSNWNCLKITTIIILVLLIISSGLLLLSKDKFHTTTSIYLCIVEDTVFTNTKTEATLNSLTVRGKQKFYLKDNSDSSNFLLIYSRSYPIEIHKAPLHDRSNGIQEHLNIDTIKGYIQKIKKEKYYSKKNIPTENITTQISYVIRKDSLYNTDSLCWKDIKSKVIKKIILSQLPFSERLKALQFPGVWRLSTPRKFEIIIAGIIICTSFLIMLLSYCLINKEKEQIPNYWNIEDKEKFSGLDKVQDLKSLFIRDFGSLSYDMATHESRAEVNEYRGLIHWHRDVIEKFLSVFLIFIFSFFVAKAIGYFYDYCCEDNIWRLCLISLDINFVITFIGWTLIIDGLVIVASMMDAPGVSKTLDSLIVILAGIIVMLFNAAPDEISLVRFRVEAPQWLLPGLAITICFLFFARWIVRHHTVEDWRGIKTNSPIRRQNIGTPKR